MVDVFGRMLAQKSKLAEKGTNTFPFEISYLTAGTYYLHYNNPSSDEKGVIKFVKN